MRSVFLVLIFTAAACGPGSRNSQNCTGADCNSGTCNQGDHRDCYTGDMTTENVGPCHGGTQSCTSAGTWGDCMGEVVPQAENCTDHIDNNCNGMVDEDIDADGDGWTTCAGDCCDSTECSNPAEVNPGAYDVPGDGVDNDCNGVVDDPVLLCDQGLMFASTDPMDFAKAIDICQTTTMTDRKWGVIDGAFTLADGTGAPNPASHAIMAHYGTGVLPHGGQNLMMISSGYAAAEGDPGFDPGLSSSMGTTSGMPADFVAANGGTLPNAPGCPAPLDPTTANDPIMLTLHVRVPTNAQSFSLDINFFSDEFPEYTCSPYNDFFVVLLDSMYSGTNPNPMDKNLAFYTDPQMKKWPVGVNLASGNTGLFTQCVNGTTGCDGTPGSITTCTGITELQGTGLEASASGQCDATATMGGGTGWLTTSGNVKPGEIMTLRIGIWDTSDPILDTMAVIDNFKWSADPSTPGTVIFRGTKPQPGLTSQLPVRAE